MMQGGHLPLSSRADWSCTARNPPPEGKDHEGFAPSYSAAGENHLHHGTQVCRIFLISWCWCYASAAIQLRKLVVHSTKFPAGAVQPAQWRELEVSSSRAPAKSPVVMRCARRLSKLRFSSLSVWNRRRGKKTMRAARPHTLRQVRVTCTTANRFAVFYKNSMVQVLCICRVPAAQAGPPRSEPRNKDIP